MSKKYGSFDVEIIYYNEYGKKNSKIETVLHLSQQELADGWRLVLPKRTKKSIIKKNNNNKDINIRKTNESFFKINLAQLPPHLFNRLKSICREGHILHYIVRDNCYVYIVNPTPVDNEIKNLFEYCQLYDRGFTLFTDEQNKEIKNCLFNVNEQEIKGWVVMKSNRLFSNL